MGERKKEKQIVREREIDKQIRVHYQILQRWISRQKTVLNTIPNSGILSMPFLRSW